MPELTEGAKFDSDKVRFDLLAPEFLIGISYVLTFGAKKYNPHNWKKGILYSRVYAALQRHLNAFWRGETLDEETGVPHLWHAGCCLMFLSYYEDNVGFSDFDDRAFSVHGVHR